MPWTSLIISGWGKRIGGVIVFGEIIPGVSCFIIKVECGIGVLVICIDVIGKRGVL